MPDLAGGGGRLDVRTDQLCPNLVVKLGFLGPELVSEAPAAGEAAPERDFATELHAVAVVAMQVVV